MDLNVFALFSVAIASAGLSLVVYSRAPDRPSNRLWAVHALLVALWAFVDFLIVTSTSIPAAIAYLRLAHFLSAVVLVTFVDFCWVFPERLNPGFSPPRRALYLSALAVGAIASLPVLVQSMQMTPTGPDVRLGWPLFALGAYAAILLLYADIVMLRKARSSHGVARIQTIYVLTGAVGTQAAIVVLNVVLPAITGSTEYSRWGVVAYFLVIASVTIAIAKHSLWDLSSAGRQGLAAIAAVASMGVLAGIGVYFLVGRWSLFAARPLHLATFWIITGCLLGASLDPLYRWLRGVFSRSFREERQRIGRLLSALGAAIVHPAPSGAALMPILTETQEFFGVTFVSAYLRLPDGEYRNMGSIGKQATLEIPSLDVPGSVLPQGIVRRLRLDELHGPLSAGEIMRFGSSRDVSNRLRAMRVIGASVLVPLLWLDEMIGVLALGHKVSRDMYRASDFDLLRSVGAHAAIAVRNNELRAQIVAEKERTEKVISEMRSGVVAVDARKVIGLVNPAAKALLTTDGRDDDLLGKGVAALPSALRTYLEQAIDRGTTVSDQRLFLHQAGGVRMAISTFVLTGPDGDTEGAGIVFRDLRTEDALRQAEQEAEHLRFVRAVSAGMAHEIRNPLVAIRTFAELAPQRLDDPEFREEFLQVAQSEVGRLEDLVSQFMTLARPIRMVREAVDVRELAQRATSVVSANAQAQRVQLTKSIPPHVPQVSGDESRLYQALINLLMNAVDATGEGGHVQLGITCGDGDDDVCLAVWNSRSYIPPDKRARLFEPFFTTKTKGAGLGLTICHTIIDEHGGKMEVESDENEGTTFILRLPTVSHHDARTVSTP